ncbi:hypothetical protein BDN70DRAFT_762673, partial [Pholiota conissans]
WTTGPEFEWLKRRIPAYLEAHEKNTTDTFFSGIYEEWGGSFQIPEPTASDIKQADGDVEVATVRKRKKFEKRLKQWFRNNTRSGS